MDDQFKSSPGSTEPLNSMDIVQIESVDNVKWLSGPPGTKPSPHGYWTISYFIGSDAVIAKDGALVRIPVNDIRRIGSFTIQYLFEQLANVGINKENEYIDMIDVISKEFGWDHMKSKLFLRRYGLPLDAKTIEHKEIILVKAKSVAIENEEDSA